jgi:hypothetical protein
VARSNPRLAAGVGVVSAFLLLGGPGLAAAIADPGYSGGSERGDSSDRDWGGSRSGPNGGSDNRDGDNGNRRGNDSLRPGHDNGPWTRVGSGRGDTQDLTPGNRSDSSDRSGSDPPGTPSAKFEPPRVTVGNGRSPGVQDKEREPRSRIAPEPAPPPPLPPPPPEPAPSWVDRLYTPPAMPKQLGVAPAANLADPLWGIAGLLLIPVAGAVLGYRQARAAQMAEGLHRS